MGAQKNPKLSLAPRGMGKSKQHSS